MIKIFHHIFFLSFLFAAVACGAGGAGGNLGAPGPAGGGPLDAPGSNAVPVQETGVGAPPTSIGEDDYAGLIEEKVTPESTVTSASAETVSVQVKGRVLDCFGNSVSNLKGRTLRIIAQGQYVDVVLQDGNVYSFSWRVKNGSWDVGTFDSIGWGHYLLPTGYAPITEGKATACSEEGAECSPYAQPDDEKWLSVHYQSAPGIACDFSIQFPPSKVGTGVRSYPTEIYYRVEDILP